MSKNLGYTLCGAYKIALQYKHKSDFMNENISLYKYSYRRGWTKLLFAHMTRKKKTPKWSEHEIYEEAKKYSVKNEFMNNSPSAYHAARVRGILIDVCSHMKRRLLPEEVSTGRNCNFCGDYKTIDLFCKDDRSKSGISSMCKDCHSIRSSKYAKDNIEWKRTQTAKRRALRKNAAPKWLTKKHFNEIQKIYEECEEMSKISKITHEVDHIIPIQNEHVCGLHVPWNLQILTREENRSKLNKFSLWWDNATS